MSAVFLCVARLLKLSLKLLQCDVKFSECLFCTRFLNWLFEKQLVKWFLYFMILSVLFDYIIWVAIYKYQTPPKGGKGGCAFIAWISIFEPPAHPA